jgi:hypothetical protein
MAAAHDVERVLDLAGKSQIRLIEYVGFGANVIVR